MALKTHNFPFRLYDENAYQTKDKVLFSRLHDEFTYLYGLDCKYIPVEQNQIDTILGDILHQKIIPGIPIRLYSQNTESDFSRNETTMFSKFGDLDLQLTDIAFWVTKDYLTTDYGITPKPGDLIYVLRTKTLLEVEFPDLVHNFRYKIICSFYNFDHQEIDVTVPEQEIKDLDTVSEDENLDFNQPIEDAGSTIIPTSPESKDGLWD